MVSAKLIQDFPIMNLCCLDEMACSPYLDILRSSDLAYGSRFIPTGLYFFWFFTSEILLTSLSNRGKAGVVILCP